MMNFLYRAEAPLWFMEAMLILGVLAAVGISTLIGT
jgi:hypothetical protein